MAPASALAPAGFDITNLAKSGSGQILKIKSGTALFSTNYNEHIRKPTDTWYIVDGYEAL